MLNHNYIGTEHELRALIHAGEGVAARALTILGISMDAARQEVTTTIGTGQAAPTAHIPFTPRAKKVLELAFREARQLGHDYIGTEHILLGLIREGEGVGAQVLQKLGANPTAVRQTVMQLLAGYTGGGEAGFFVEPERGGSERMMREGPRCPSCDRSLEDALRYRRLVAAPADEGEAPMPVLVLFCGRCGQILRSFRGVGGLPPRTEPGDLNVEED